MLGTSPQNLNPSGLSGCHQWLCWRWGQDVSLEATTFINVETGERASLSDSETWHDLTKARLFRNDNPALVDGIGVVLTDNDPFFRLTLYDALEIFSQTTPWAEKLIHVADTYTEECAFSGDLALIFRENTPNFNLDRMTVKDVGFVPISGNVRHGSLESISRCNRTVRSIIEKRGFEGTSS